MKKVFASIVAGALMLIGMQAFAQDIILKTDNSMVRAKIDEINGDEVVYHAYENQDGPVFKLPLSQVAKIQFSNGTEQVFSSQPAAPASPQYGPSNTAGNMYVGKLLRDGDELLLNGRELSDQEIQALIGQQIWEETYASARAQYKAGKALMGVGIPFFSVGLGFFAAGLIVSAAADEPQVGAILAGYIGAPFMGAGGTLMSFGIPLRIIGSKRLNWAVDEANKNRGYAMKEPTLNFGVQRYGMGIALRF